MYCVTEVECSEKRWFVARGVTVAGSFSRDIADKPPRLFYLHRGRGMWLTAFLLKLGHLLVTCGGYMMIGFRDDCELPTE
jgi:hypothetical protein